MEPKELIRKRQSIWNHAGLLFWPAIFLIIGWLIRIFVGEDFHYFVPLAISAIAAFCWLLAWIKARMNTYVVFEDTVFAQKKFISRVTSEARIAVMRSINIRQTLYQRVVRIGDVVFRSAGDLDDVVFAGIPDPEGIKRIVQQQQTVIEEKSERNEATA